MKRVVIVGGGPAGMMAAIAAAERGAQVTLLEKNTVLGKKLRITGGGRCNVTNNTPDVRLLLRKYGDAEQFLYAPFSQFAVQDTIDFFAKRGVPFVEENDGRLFPKTLRAETIANTLVQELKRASVDVVLGAQVTGFVTHNDNVITAVRVQGKPDYEFDACIVSTGGNSRPDTGSAGDALPWLKAAGHTIVKPALTLVPIRTKETFTHAMSGLSYGDAKITLSQNGTILTKAKGKLLFTHFGLSGPLVLNMSKAITDALRDDPVVLMLDLYPTVDDGTFDREILEGLAPHQNKTLANALKEIFPPLLVNAVLAECAINPELRTHQFSRDMRKIFIAHLKHLTLTPTGSLGSDKAIVSSGGVPLREIDTRTMRSQKCHNLFVVGDALDIDRPSGGYSLQLCWTTGYVAGNAAAHL